jgi:histidine triad (HIT) family protein
MTTIFKKIIDGQVPADLVYEDDTVLVFLDIQPIRKGHALIIPKEPYVDIFDIPADTFAHMAMVAQKIARALMLVTKAQGVNLHMNNGEVAGQDVFHAHLHVIPRFERGEAFENPSHESYEAGESAHIAAELRKTLHGA